jgi:hypothetical protein
MSAGLYERPPLPLLVEDDYSSHELGEYDISPVEDHQLPLSTCEYSTKLCETQQFILEKGLFHSDRDQKIALMLAEGICNAFIAGNLSSGELDETLQSLQALVPVDNGSGKRKIDDKTLPPFIETKIASRLASKEVDIAGDEGSWGRLPEVVKSLAISHESELRVELTTNCTVGCSFCEIADKAPVEEKASFDSVVSVIRYFSDKQYIRPGTLRSDILYWGTDPFDAKWEATDTSLEEKDYTDIANAYNEINKGRARGLFTSTSIPIGEEFRVLNFANEFLGKMWMPQSVGTLRFSATNYNASRLEHIQNIIKALHPQTYKQVVVNKVPEHTALRGNKLGHDRTIDLWDITGPNCRDAIIIGPRQVDGIYMQGASNERPTGEVREPVETHPKGEDKVVYTIPRQCIRPGLQGTDLVERIYPDTILDVVEISGEIVSISEREMTNDPHRALLRIAGALTHYKKASERQWADYYGFKDEFEEIFSPDILIIQDYLRNGGDNWVMRRILNSPLITSRSKDGEVISEIAARYQRKNNSTQKPA